MKKNKFGKEIFFLFIGFLLLLSIILCVYVISEDREYIQTTANVVEVNKNEVVYSYFVKGEEKFSKSKKKDGIKVGDKVIYSKYAGSEFKVDGKELTIIRQSDILAVVED